MNVKENFLALLKDFLLIIVIGIFFAYIFLTWIGSVSPLNALLFVIEGGLGLFVIFGGLGLAIYIVDYIASKK